MFGGGEVGGGEERRVVSVSISIRMSVSVSVSISMSMRVSMSVNGFAPAHFWRAKADRSPYAVSEWAS